MASALSAGHAAGQGGAGRLRQLRAAGGVRAAPLIGHRGEWWGPAAAGGKGEVENQNISSEINRVCFVV